MFAHFSGRPDQLTKAHTHKGENVKAHTLRAKEQFDSYQGTGALAGTYQRFVRLAGCRVKCPLRSNCDQPDALGHSQGEHINIDELVASAQSSGWLHITGGEPAEHEHMVELCDRAISAGLLVQVQTSGSISIEWKQRPFVSVSPKQRQILTDPDEIILVACNWMTDDFALEVTRNARCEVFVIPEATDGYFGCGRMLELISVLRSNGIQAKAGLQSHIIWGIS